MLESQRAPGSLCSKQDRRHCPGFSKPLQHTGVGGCGGKRDAANKTVMDGIKTLSAAGQVALPLWVSI